MSTILDALRKAQAKHEDAQSSAVADVDAGTQEGHAAAAEEPTPQQAKQEPDELPAFDDIAPADRLGATIRRRPSAVAALGVGLLGLTFGLGVARLLTGKMPFFAGSNEPGQVASSREARNGEAVNNSEAINSSEASKKKSSAANRSEAASGEAKKPGEATSSKRAPTHAAASKAKPQHAADTATSPAADAAPAADAPHGEVSADSSTGTPPVAPPLAAPPSAAPPQNPPAPAAAPPAAPIGPVAANPPVPGEAVAPMPALPDGGAPLVPPPNGELPPAPPPNAAAPPPAVPTVSAAAGPSNTPPAPQPNPVPASPSAAGAAPVPVAPPTEPTPVQTAAAEPQAGGPAVAAEGAGAVLETPPTGAPEVSLLFIKWSHEVARRVASLRGPAGKLMLVHEGDIVEGMRVSTIRPDAIELQWRGTNFLLFAAR